MPYSTGGNTRLQVGPARIGEENVSQSFRLTFAGKAVIGFANRSIAESQAKKTGQIARHFL